MIRDDIERESVWAAGGHIRTAPMLEGHTAPPVSCSLLVRVNALVGSCYPPVLYSSCFMLACLFHVLKKSIVYVYLYVYIYI